MFLFFEYHFFVLLSVFLPARGTYVQLRGKEKRFLHLNETAHFLWQSLFMAVPFYDSPLFIFNLNHFFINGFS